MNRKTIKIDTTALFCYGPIQFFLLDSNREQPYPYTQRQWLKQQLGQNRARWKIVVLHHPLFSVRGKTTAARFLNIWSLRLMPIIRKTRHFQIE